MAVKVSLSVLGLLVGGVVGAALRPLVLYYHIGTGVAGNGTASVLGISAIIGFLAGGAAGLIGKPLWSALAGAVFFAAAYLATLIPLAFCLCLGGLERAQAVGEPPAWWMMAVAGAIAGLAGGAAELLVAARPPTPPPADVPPPDGEA